MATDKEQFEAWWKTYDWWTLGDSMGVAWAAWQAALESPEPEADALSPASPAGAAPAEGKLFALLGQMPWSQAATDAAEHVVTDAGDSFDAYEGPDAFHLSGKQLGEVVQLGIEHFIEKLTARSVTALSPAPAIAPAGAAASKAYVAHGPGSSDPANPPATHVFTGDPGPAYEAPAGAAAKHQRIGLSDADLDEMAAAYAEPPASLAPAATAEAPDELARLVAEFRTADHMPRESVDRMTELLVQRFEAPASPAADRKPNILTLVGSDPGLEGAIEYANRSAEQDAVLEEAARVVQNVAAVKVVRGPHGEGELSERLGTYVRDDAIAAIRALKGSAAATDPEAGRQALRACRLFLSACRCVDIHHHGFGPAFNVAQAAVWLASNEPGTPVPDWVDRAVNGSDANQRRKQ